MTFCGAVGRGLRLRCPRCGEGRLFRGLFSMHPACGACGLDFLREQGYYVGAMYINYGVTAGIEIAAGLWMVGRLTLVQLTIPLAVFAVIFPLVFFRYSRSLWLGLQTYVESRTQT
jgi:uncharacterized protein (DUF983 family)